MNYHVMFVFQGKLLIKSLLAKVEIESSTYLERIHGDICGHISPPRGLFKYFMVLIDLSIR